MSRPPKTVCENIWEDKNPKTSMSALYSTIAGPFRHQNLELFFLRGPQSIPDREFIPLHEAFEQQKVVVHETGTVAELQVENQSDIELFIQAGDVVKGGWQDRTLGVDLVVPAKGGRVSIPAFCVEAGRWSKRRNESDAVFSKSDSTLASKALRLAAKLGKNQAEVWQSVASFQGSMGRILNSQVQSAVSPSSYQLSMENEMLQKSKNLYANVLKPALKEFPDAVGFVFAINGKPNSADIYGSHDLFRRLWARQLDVAVVEALLEAGTSERKSEHSLSAEFMEDWLNSVVSVSKAERREVCPGVWLRTSKNRAAVVFDTICGAGAGPVLHRNIIAMN